MQSVQISTPKVIFVYSLEINDGKANFAAERGITIQEFITKFVNAITVIITIGTLLNGHLFFRESLQRAQHCSFFLEERCDLIGQNIRCPSIWWCNTCAASAAAANFEFAAALKLTMCSHSPFEFAKKWSNSVFDC